MKKIAFVVLFIAAAILAIFLVSARKPITIDLNGKRIVLMCDNRGESEYAPVMKFNDIRYNENSRSSIGNLQKGKKLGEIKYRIADDGCLNYVMQNGDATLLKTGTELFEVQGYASSARLIAGDWLYQASENPKAHTINDLLDISGKIIAVRFISGNDGVTILKDFTPEASEVFAEEFPKLAYIPFDTLYKETKGWVGGKYWMQIELSDGSTIGISYNEKFAAFHPAGYATPELALLVEEQRKRIYVK